MNVNQDQDKNGNILAENKSSQDIAEENEITEVQDQCETKGNEKGPTLNSSSLNNSNTSNEKQIYLASIELTVSKNDGISKETDDWEVVEASSDESEDSIHTEYDIKIPLKLLEKGPPSTQGLLTVNTSPLVPAQKAALSEVEANSNDDDHIVIGSNLENISTQQSSNNTQSKPSLNEKQTINTKTAKPNVTKKRKFRLFTGESDDEIIPQEISHKTHFEKQVSSKENVQKGVQPEQSKPTATNNVTHRPNKNNSSTLDETYTKSKPKSYSDTEVTDDNLALRRNARETNLPNVREESDDEIEVVPSRSPPFDNKSNKHIVNSRNNPGNLDRSPHKHNYQCSTASLGSPNQGKRQKLIQHIWQERERKLKMKMVKRVKYAFFQVLESLMSSSDESDVLSASDDETGFDRMLKRKRSIKSRLQCSQTYQQQNNEPENMRDLKREIQYWKKKAQSKPEVLSPQELQMKEMREKLNYWKKIAMTRSKGNDIQSTSSSISKINSPVIEYEEASNKRPTPGFNGTSGVTSADTAGNPSHFSIPDLVDHADHRPSTNENLNEGENTSSHNRPNQTNLSRDETFKAANGSYASHALSVMSRTKFTEKEKDSMVQYLVQHYDSLELMKGNMFWMQMAHDIDTYRSWHSLKNNFFQSILKNLEQYEMPVKVRNKIISIAKQYM